MAGGICLVFLLSARFSLNIFRVNGRCRFLFAERSYCCSATVIERRSAGEVEWVRSQPCLVNLATHPLLIRTQSHCCCDRQMSEPSQQRKRFIRRAVVGCEVLSAAIGAASNRAEPDQYAAPFEADSEWTRGRLDLIKRIEEDEMDHAVGPIRFAPEPLSAIKFRLRWEESTRRGQFT
jgi:hypothetical protein